MLPRKHFFDKNVEQENTTGTKPKQNYEQEDTAPKLTKKDDANLISSELDYPYDSAVPADEHLHAPTLDIDFPIQCYESSTPGHYHLLIERPMTWKQYKKFLYALMKAGIIEEGYYKASIKKGGSFLRKKGTKKEHVVPSTEQLMSWM